MLSACDYVAGELEKLLALPLRSLEDVPAWDMQADEFESILQEQYPSFQLPDHINHFMADADIRCRDVDYALGQHEEVTKYIARLRSGLPPPTKGDLTSPAAIKLKGALFLLLGTLASSLLLIENHSFAHVFLLGIAIWSFCRLYYFAFYVIQHYVDPSYRFAGLWSFICYLANRGRPSEKRE